MKRLLLTTLPILLAVGCSRPNPQAAAPAQTAGQTVAPAAPAPAAQAPNPEPVAVPPAPAPSPVPREAAPPVARAVVVPRGARLRVRLDRALDTRRNRPGDEFSATLSAPLYVNGDTLLPAGTRFRGHVTESAASGRLEGRARLGVTLDSYRLGGRDYPIRTSAVQRVGAAHKKRNGILIGGGAGLGAAIGAIAGGGKGAAIGALAGGGAGTAGAAATGKEELSMPAETALVFTVR